MDLKVFNRKGVVDVLEILSESKKGIPNRELREKTSITSKNLRMLREHGLIEFSVEKIAVREITVKLKRAFCWLSDKGKKMLELYGTIDADLLKITPKQVECLKLLKDGKKRLSEIPKSLKPTIKNLFDRDLVEKRMVEEEVKREIYARKRVYTLTEKGAKAYKAIKIIQGL